MRAVALAVAAALIAGTAAAQSDGDQVYVVSFDALISMEQGIETVERLGGVVRYDLRPANTIVAWMTPSEADAVRNQKGVGFVGLSGPIRNLNVREPGDEFYAVALEKSITLEEGVKLVGEAGGVIVYDLPRTHLIIALLSKKESEEIAKMPGVKWIELDTEVVPL